MTPIYDFIKNKKDSNRKNKKKDEVYTMDVEAFNKAIVTLDHEYGINVTDLLNSNNGKYNERTATIKYTGKKNDDLAFRDFQKSVVLIENIAKGGILSSNEHEQIYTKVYGKYDKSYYKPRRNVDYVGTTEPTVTEPTVTEPTITEPTVTEPTITEPTITEPTVTEPTVTEPTVIEPTVIEPTVIEPTVTKPTTSRSNKKEDKNVVKLPVKSPVVEHDTEAYENYFVRVIIYGRENADKLNNRFAPLSAGEKLWYNEFMKSTLRKNLDIPDNATPREVAKLMQFTGDQIYRPEAMFKSTARGEESEMAKLARMADTIYSPSEIVTTMYKKNQENAAANKAANTKPKSNPNESLYSIYTRRRK